MSALFSVGLLSIRAVICNMVHSPFYAVIPSFYTKQSLVCFPIFDIIVYFSHKCNAVFLVFIISLDDNINIIICLGVWKFLQKTILTLMLLLHELRKKNLISLFTILTGIILIIANGLLGESGLWIYSSSSVWDVITQYLVGVIFLLSAIVYTEHIRDISL